MKLITDIDFANPRATAQKYAEITRRHGLIGMRIICVVGDDLLPVINKYMNVEV